MSVKMEGRFRDLERHRADEATRGAALRASRQAEKDERARLLERIADLERDLARARRCIAAERFAREGWRCRARAALEAAEKTHEQTRGEPLRERYWTALALCRVRKAVEGECES